MNQHDWNQLLNDSGFINDLKEFINDYSDVSDSIVDFIKDDSIFKDALNASGSIGQILNLSLSFFKILNRSKKKEQTKNLEYVTLETLRETLNKLDIKLDDINLGQHFKKNILKSLFKIQKDNQSNDTNSIYSIPIIATFRSNIFNIITNSKLQEIVNFSFYFDTLLYKKVKDDTKFKGLRDSLDSADTQTSRAKYLNSILEKINKPLKVDGKRIQDYYIKNRTIEITNEENDQSDDCWNMKDIDYEYLYKEGNEFSLEQFLRAGREDNTRFIVSSFGNGKTSYSKNLFIEILRNHFLSPDNRFFPIYIELKNGPKNAYENYDLRCLVTNIIKPRNENILIIADGLDEYQGNRKILLEELDNLLKRRCSHQGEYRRYSYPQSEKNSHN